MSDITVKIDVALWLNNKGHVELFFEDEPKPIESLSLLDLLHWGIDSHKVFGRATLDRDDAKKFVKLKKVLTQCLDHLNREMSEAK